MDESTNFCGFWLTRLSLTLALQPGHAVHFSSRGPCPGRLVPAWRRLWHRRISPTSAADSVGLGFKVFFSYVKLLKI